MDTLIFLSALFVNVTHVELSKKFVTRRLGSACVKMASEEIGARSAFQDIKTILTASPVAAVTLAVLPRSVTSQENAPAWRDSRARHAHSVPLATTSILNAYLVIVTLMGQ